MKRALLCCIVGVMCMGAIPYAAIGWDFPGDLTVQDKVGIGTTSPTARLDIQSNPDPASLTGTVSVSTGGVTVTGSGTQFMTQLAVGDVVTMDTGTYTVINVVSNTVIFIDPLYQGVTASGINIYLGAVTVPPLLSIEYRPNGGVATPKVTVTGIGNVGIGTTTPAAKLDVAGNLQAQTVSVTGNLSTGSVYSPGQLFGKSVVINITGLTSNANRALCWSADGHIGYCTSAIGSNGVCTCVAIQ